MMYIDIAAKIYIFLLLISAFFLGFKKLLFKEYLRSARVFGLLSSGLMYIYILKYIDDYFQLWQCFGGDFSLQVAFIVAFSIAITSVKPWAEALMVFLCVYVIAVLYQDYSALGSILFSFIVVGLPLFLLQLYVIKVTKTARMSYSESE